VNDLRIRLERLSERGNPRGADVVLEAAAAGLDAGSGDDGVGQEPGEKSE
jgi:hypothetical protein